MVNSIDYEKYPEMENNINMESINGNMNSNISNMMNNLRKKMPHLITVVTEFKNVLQKTSRKFENDEINFFYLVFRDLNYSFENIIRFSIIKNKYNSIQLGRNRLKKNVSNDDLYKVIDSLIDTFNDFGKMNINQEFINTVSKNGVLNQLKIINEEASIFYVNIIEFTNDLKQFNKDSNPEILTSSLNNNSALAAGSSKKSVKKSPVKKSPVKKSPVKKSPVKKSPVKKSPVKKSPVKKSPVKKSPVKK